MNHSSDLMIPGIILLGIACQWIAWRIQVPAILPLLILGILVGPVFNIANPKDYLGEIYEDIISFSVAIILFEGSLTLKFREIGTQLKFVRNLVTIGAFITLICTTLVTHYLLGINWEIASIFGALMVVTGPTVIIPLLRQTRANARVSSILKWEGIIIDPIGALVAVLIYDVVISYRLHLNAGFAEMLIEFAFMFLSAILIGSLMGLIIYVILQRYLIPDYLRDIAILGIVLGTFGVSNYIHQDSGLLAVTVMGMLLANVQLRQVNEIWHFKEKLSVLLVSVLFIILASSIEAESLSLLNTQSFLLLICLILIRPLAVFASSFFLRFDRNITKLTLKEKLFLSWIAPRGIVAASIASLFALELYKQDIDGAQYLAPLTFLVIVGTVLLQSLTARPIAKVLQVSDLDPQGFLFLSANQFARMLANLLQSEGFKVKLVDNNLTHVRAAQLLNLDVIYGDILSEEVEKEADFSGIGRLLTFTRNAEANILACSDYKNFFGSSEVYRLPTKNEEFNKQQIGRVLFSMNHTMVDIYNLINKGAQIEKHELTKEYTYENFQEDYQEDKVLLLLAYKRNENNKLIVNISTTDQILIPEPSWTILVLHKTLRK